MYCESFKSSTVDLWPAVSWHSRHLWLATPLSPLTPDLCTLCQIVTSEPEWWVRDEENEPKVSSAIWLVDWSPAEHTSLCTVFWCSRLLPWILSHDVVQCLSNFCCVDFFDWEFKPCGTFCWERTKFTVWKVLFTACHLCLLTIPVGGFSAQLLCYLEPLGGEERDNRWFTFFFLLSPLSLSPSLPLSPQVRGTRL